MYERNLHSGSGRILEAFLQPREFTLAYLKYARNIAKF